MAFRNEAHIVNAQNGHIFSTDCWCEPIEIRWYLNKHKVKMLVVMHEDFIPPVIHHHDLLEARDENPDDWITPLLNAVKETHYGTND